MPPRTPRPKRGTQSAAARAWDRSLNRLQEIGIKIQNFTGSGQNCGLSQSEVDTAVDDLSVLISRADSDDDSTTPGAWAALDKRGCVSCLLALYGVAARCSSDSLSPGLPDSARFLHTKLRVKLAKELNNISHDVEGHISKRTVRAIAAGILNTHILRCYAALLSDAERPLLTNLRELGLPAEAAVGHPGGQGAQRISPHRRLVKVLSEVLGEASDVLTFLNDVASRYAAVAPSSEAIGSRLGTELPASGLLEFYARGVLLLASCEGCEREAAALTESLCTVINAVRHRMVGVNLLLASSPSLSYMLSAHVAQMCAALDGGGVYDMLPAVASWSAPLMALLPGGDEGVVGPTAVCLNALSMVLALWAAICRDCAMCGQENRLVVAPLLKFWSPELGVPPLVSYPSRSLRQACQAYMRVLERNQAMFVSMEGKVRASMGLQAAQEGLGKQLALQREETAAVLSFLERLLPMMDRPPWNAGYVMEMCLRLAAAASAALPLPDGADSTSASSRQQQRLRVAGPAVGGLARDALACGRSAILFFDTLATATPLPRRAVRQMEAYFREALSWAEVKAGGRGPEAQRMVQDWNWNDVGSTLAFEDLQQTSTTSMDTPSVTAVAALSAGYFSGLKNVLRRLTRPESELIEATCFLAPILRSVGGKYAKWRSVMAFAPLNDVVDFLEAVMDCTRQVVKGLKAAGSAAGTASASDTKDPTSTFVVAADTTRTWLFTIGPLAECGEDMGRRPHWKRQESQQQQQENPTIAVGSGSKAVATTEAMSSRQGQASERTEGAVEGAPPAAPSTPRAQPGAPRPSTAAEAEAEAAQEQAAAETTEAVVPRTRTVAVQTESDLLLQQPGSDTDVTAEEQFLTVTAFTVTKILPCVWNAIVYMLPLCIKDRFRGKKEMVDGLNQLLEWLPILAAASAEREQSAGTSAAAATSEAEVDGAGGWAMYVEQQGQATQGLAARPLDWSEILFRRLGVMGMLASASAVRREGSHVRADVTPLKDAIVALAWYLPRRFGAALHRVDDAFLPGSIGSTRQELRWLLGPGGAAEDPELLADLERLGEDGFLERRLEQPPAGDAAASLDEERGSGARVWASTDAVAVHARSKVQQWWEGAEALREVPPGKLEVRVSRGVPGALAVPVF